MVQLKDLNDPFEGLYVERLKFRKAEDITSEEVQHVLRLVAAEKDKTILRTSDFNVSSLSSEELFSQKQHVAFATNRIFNDLLEMKELNYVCCFNQDKLQKLSGKHGWVKSNVLKAIESKLMWSHYGNGLRGMAIEFTQKDLHASISNLNRELLNSENNIVLDGDPMDYDGQYKMDTLSLMLEYGKSRKGNGPAAVLLMKCKEWEYEQEYRITICPSKKLLIDEHSPRGLEINYAPDSIKSITIGQKMSEENRVELLKVATKLNLHSKLQVAEIDLETFRLKIVPYDDSLFS
ncbi:DUF2971 domain-containing protein [Shewanella goraebulensis]|uniref:DUF2971 domain-containing protein n=1 Tax=Shewanella goraebulensis TaxID=3050637 RepID=UPI00254DAEF1|nr:DUF2971 domain-containing protein [Shewanella goraebulensis]